jgi:hypothetical protein
MSPPLDDVVMDHVSADLGSVDSRLNCLAILMRFHGPRPQIRDDGIVFND